MGYALLLLAAGAVVDASSAGPGDAAFAAGDFDGAQRFYAAQITAAPNDASALLGLGTIELYDNDLAAAKIHLSRALQLDPQETRARARLQTLAEREPNSADFRVTMTAAQVVVPFVTTDPLPILRARINGHEATLLLDTGAPAVAINPQSSRRLGITLQSGGEGVFAGGKRAPVQRGRIESIAFTGLTVRGVPVDALPGSLKLGGYAIDGAIGTSFLARFLSTIDYAGGRLIFRSASAAASADFERNARDTGASIVPMWLVGDHFLFARASVNGAASGLFNVDTGGAGLGVQLTNDSLQAAGITVDQTKAQSFVGGGGPARAVPFSANTVTVGTTVRHAVPGLYFPNGDQYGIFPFKVAGTLSHEFFRGTALTFDFTSMQLVVESPGRKS